MGFPLETGESAAGLLESAVLLPEVVLHFLSAPRVACRLHAANSAESSPTPVTGLVTVVDPSTGNEVRVESLASPDVEALPALGLVVDQGISLPLENALRRTVYIDGTAIQAMDGLVAGRWRVTVLTRPAGTPQATARLVVEALRLLGIRQAVSAHIDTLGVTSFLHGTGISLEQAGDFLDLAGAPDVVAVTTGSCPRWRYALDTATTVEELERLDIAVSGPVFEEESGAARARLCHASITVLHAGADPTAARAALERVLGHLPGAVSPLSSCNCASMLRS